MDYVGQAIEEEEGEGERAFWTDACYEERGGGGGANRWESGCGMEADKKRRRDDVAL